MTPAGSALILRLLETQENQMTIYETAHFPRSKPELILVRVPAEVFGDPFKSGEVIAQAEKIFRKAVVLVGPQAERQGPNYLTSQVPRSQDALDALPWREWHVAS